MWAPILTWDLFADFELEACISASVSTPWVLTSTSFLYYWTNSLPFIAPLSLTSCPRSTTGGKYGCHNIVISVDSWGWLEYVGFSFPLPLLVYIPTRYDSSMILFSSLLSMSVMDLSPSNAVLIKYARSSHSLWSCGKPMLPGRRLFQPQYSQPYWCSKHFQ